MGAYLDEVKCPVCGKLFIIPPANRYKLTIKKQVYHYCSYHCFREVQKKLEGKKYNMESY